MSFRQRPRLTSVERETDNATTLFTRFGVVLLRLYDGDVAVEADA